MKSRRLWSCADRILWLSIWKVWSMELHSAVCPANIYWIGRTIIVEKFLLGPRPPDNGHRGLDAEAQSSIGEKQAAPAGRSRKHVKDERCVEETWAVASFDETSGDQHQWAYRHGSSCCKSTTNQPRTRWGRLYKKTVSPNRDYRSIP